MKSILTATAILEGLTGLALLVVPSFVVTTLFGNSMIGAIGLLLARLAGAVLVALATACWFLRKELQASIMVKLMASYNIFSIILLVYASMVDKLYGFGLWPTVIIHAGLLLWCIASLLKRATN
jgi:hypothetical protein